MGGGGALLSQDRQELQVARRRDILSTHVAVLNEPLTLVTSLYFMLFWRHSLRRYDCIPSSCFYLARYCMLKNLQQV